MIEISQKELEQKEKKPSKLWWELPLFPSFDIPNNNFELRNEKGFCQEILTKQVSVIFWLVKYTFIVLMLAKSPINTAKNKVTSALHSINYNRGSKRNYSKQANHHSY